MKKLLLLFTVLLLAAEFLHAQVPVIMSGDKELGPNGQVKAGGLLTFKLKNVNPFYYDVVINATSTTYDYGNEGSLLSGYLKNATKSFDSQVPSQHEESADKDGRQKMIPDALPENLPLTNFETQFDLVIKEVLKLNQLDELDTALKALVMTASPLNYGNMAYKRDQTVIGILGIPPGETNYLAILNNHFTGTYIRLEESITELTVRYNLLSDLEQKIVESKKSFIEELLEEIDKDEFEKKFASVREYYINIRKDAFCVTKNISVPKKANEIKIVYTVKEKTNRISKDKKPKTIAKDSVTVFVKKMFNLNASAGGMLTWLNDYEYTTISVDKDGKTVQQIALQNSSKVEFATGGLVHVYANCTPNFSPALSFGFAVNGDNDLRYLAGLSAILGRKQRIIISGGVVAGKTGRLAETQKIDQIVESSNDIQMISPIKANGFISLTYNF